MEGLSELFNSEKLNFTELSSLVVRLFYYIPLQNITAEIAEVWLKRLIIITT